MIEYKKNEILIYTYNKVLVGKITVGDTVDFLFCNLQKSVDVFIDHIKRHKSNIIINPFYEYISDGLKIYEDFDGLFHIRTTKQTENFCLFANLFLEKINTGHIT